MSRRLRKHLDGKTAWILLGLVMLALVLDFIFFTGFYASDDVEYIQSSHSIASDGYLSPGFGNTRIGLVLPNALVWWITGSLTALLWFQVVYHLALVSIAYVLGRLLFDQRAGLIAAALIAIDPLLYGYAGAVLPDNCATCWLGLSMIALVATRRYADPGVGPLSWNRRRFVGYFVAGAMIGLSYWCKETGLILTVPAAIFIITAGPSVRSLVWIQNGAIFTLGLVVVFAIELLVLRGLTGEWINRLTYVSDTADEVRAIMQEEGTTPFARIGYAAGLVTRWMPLSTWLLLAGSIAYGLTRTRNVGIMMFFWFPAVYLTVGSTSFSEYLPPPLQARYYAIVVLPAIVMTAIVASMVLQRWQARSSTARTRLAVVAAVLIVAGVECRNDLSMSGTLYRATDAQAFSAALERASERYPELPVVVAPYYARRMGPLLLGRDDLILDGLAPRPEPPYVYIRKATTATEYPDPDPVIPRSQRIDEAVIVTAPRNRRVMLVRSIRQLVGLDTPEGPAGDTHWWAELMLVR